MEHLTSGQENVGAVTGSDTLREYVYTKLRAAKAAASTLAASSTEDKNTALDKMAEALWAYRVDILAANEEDVAAARESQVTEARIDRLRLSEDRIIQMMEGLRQLIVLDDPVGDVLETIHRPNGLEIRKVRVPMGVIAMVYEARPNVTVDAAGLAIKTGNAIVLRGGREALRSNKALVAALHQGLSDAGVNPETVQLIERVEHASVDLIIQARGLVNLAIPRGGAGLISRVVEGARVPVIETGVGNCHVYVDAEADLDKALAIAINAKVQRPSVCNAMETLLVHRDVAEAWLPVVVDRLQAEGVLIHAGPRAMDALDAVSHTGIIPATEEDYGTEYLALELAIKVVDSVDDAMSHIAKYGTQHSESIVTENQATAERFLTNVDAAAVYHNASTRFTDGFEFGYGAEIGISTQKLHARGPMGLRELTTYKYVIRGNGQVRG